MAKREQFLVQGFRSGAVAAGIRYADRLDVGVIIADRPATAAGLFTTNEVKAPSIILNQRRLRRGMVQAVLVNSGNANACVGPQGMKNTQECTAALARLLGVRAALVLMNSTGVIGEPLPAARLQAALPRLLQSVRPEGMSDFARAIMTTDTRPKIARRQLHLPGGTITLVAAAKGAGMIMPALATMLVYILTDAALPSPLMLSFLRTAAADSFNALTIDGDTSTSDSVIFLASGASGINPALSRQGSRKFQEVLNDLCLQLAQEIAADGEGATKMFTVIVEGARHVAEADRIARRVANSPLVKTAFHAADPNWGRIMMAIGCAGVKINSGRINIFFETEKGRRVPIVEKGARAAAYSERRAHAVLARKRFSVRINLGLGAASRSIFTCDFSPQYVSINAHYRT